MNKETVVYIKMAYYSPIKKNEIMFFVGKWIELEIIVLRGLSQTEKDKYHMLSLICGNLDPPKVT
jgi:hypothetical protein